MSYLVLFSVDCVSLASKFVAVSDGQATLPAKSGPNCTSRPRALTINCSYCVRSPGSELDDPQGGKRKEGRVGWSCEGEKDFAVEEVQVTTAQAKNLPGRVAMVMEFHATTPEINCSSDDDHQ